MAAGAVGDHRAGDSPRGSPEKPGPPKPGAERGPAVRARRGDRLVVSLEEVGEADVQDLRRSRSRGGSRGRYWLLACVAGVLGLLACGLAWVILSGDEAEVARLEAAGTTRSDAFTDSVAADTTRALGTASDRDESADARLTVVDEPSWVASLETFDQSSVTLTEVDEVLRFVPGIKAGGVDAKTEVLDTSVYGSLEPGSWMVFIGPFEDEGEADGYCGRVTEVAPHCVPAFVDQFGDVEVGAVAPAPPPDDGGRVQVTEPDLYAGTAGAASCDQARLVEQLEGDGVRARAWAGVLGIDPVGIEGYVNAMTAVIVRVDTIVVNHGFSDGEAQPFTTVLQAGTAVLIDNKGVPRTRCSCGGPLLPASDAKVREVRSGDSSFDGEPWEDFDRSGAVQVIPAAEPLDSITLVDEVTGRTIDRPFATTGAEDLTGNSSVPGAGALPEIDGDVGARISEVDLVASDAGSVLESLVVVGDTWWALAYSNAGDASPSEVFRSEDGQEWELIEAPSESVVASELAAIDGKLYLFGIDSGGWRIFRFDDPDWGEVDVDSDQGRPPDVIIDSAAQGLDEVVTIGRRPADDVRVPLRSVDTSFWEQEGDDGGSPFGARGAVVSNHVADARGYVATGYISNGAGGSAPAWWTSDDGLAWRAQSFPSGTVASDFIPTALLAVGDGLLVVGSEGEDAEAQTVLLRTHDRQVWDRFELDQPISAADLVVVGNDIVLGGTVTGDDGFPRPVIARLEFTPGGGEPAPATVESRVNDPECVTRELEFYAPAANDLVGILPEGSTGGTGQFHQTPGPDVQVWEPDTGGLQHRSLGDLAEMIEHNAQFVLCGTPGNVIWIEQLPAD